MKKYITLLCCILTLSFCLSFTVSAQDGGFTVAEDLMSLTLDGETYIRMDTANTFMYQTQSIVKQAPQLTTKQQEQFLDYTFLQSPRGKLIEATFYYRAGGYLNCTFVREDYAPQLKVYQEGTEAKCFIETYSKNINVTEDELKGQPATLTEQKLEFCEYYCVYAHTEGEYIHVTTGAVIVDSNTFYYVDFSEMDRAPANFYPGDYERLDCYEITDQKLCNKLLAETEEYSLYDDSGDLFIKSVVMVYIVFFFGIIPAAILVLSLIFAIKRKGYYRLIWGITAGLCTAELVIFVMVCIHLLAP